MQFTVPFVESHLFCSKTCLLIVILYFPLELDYKKNKEHGVWNDKYFPELGLNRAIQRLLPWGYKMITWQNCRFRSLSFLVCKICGNWPDAHSELSQASKMDLFCNNSHGLKTVNYFCKNFILKDWLGSE